ncbi:AMP-binding protein [Planotetraspora sp. A-T 1434]|uniref:(2,3-dihydroxybenzoyl)adenylate synthase n=1 Tax=Planotetraspora sp. A-T 1434 TaxID=2979219 RepID=UPI0021C246F9|nr:AMP-binding protein [Planotetraspora sp. A-T 1434]MCT9933154.1 AMP-binding protein [Planotetraspora sp. A-T 1434]
MLPGCVPWPENLAQRYRAKGYWRGEVLGDLTRGADPARTAVVTAGGRYTYGQLDAWADRLAAGLADLGVRAGDRVVVQLPNSIEFVVTCLSLFRLGAPPVLALPAHRRSEIGYLCEHTEAVAYICPDAIGGFDFRELAAEVGTPHLKQVLVIGDAGPYTPFEEVTGEPRDLPAPDPGDAAFFLLSGGTTGLPKLIPRTHDDYAFQLRATAEAMGFGADGVYLAALPAAHNAALGCPGVLGALRAGGTAVLASSPSPDEVFPLIAREGVTLTTLMPAFLPLWMELAELYETDLSGLTIEVGGAQLPPHVAERVRPELGATLTHWFGMAEGVLCFTRPGDPPELPVRTQGTPLCPDDELRIVDDDDRDVPDGAVGELIVQGPCTLRGYYRAPDHNARAFTPDGFLRTGDLVRRTPGGELVVEGRIKDVVNRGGEKVPAAEVEEHLLAHPAVKDVAVIAVPDPTLGEKTCAVVVAAPGEQPTPAELRDFLTERGLAGYKRPDNVRFVDALPYTGVGKVDKPALRARFE